jgi:predicted kinase
MNKPTLFLMIGYPGAGKTTVAKIIAKLTGAVHLWADKQRREMFINPDHSHTENVQLYSELNNKTQQLLKSGKSVVFDTNFNFYKDRVKLKKIADKYGADCKVIWLDTNREVSKQRATDVLAHQKENRVLGSMPVNDFNRMSNNLQPPRPSESPLKITGIDISEQKVRQLLNL